MRALVAMSGGVDSSTTAALLLDRGYDVLGVTLRTVPDWIPAGAAANEHAIEDARSVAGHLGIEHVVLDVRQEFERQVLVPFAETYASGRTPNPCAVCNEHVKFGLLHRYVQQQGFDVLATGHYARTLEDGTLLRSLSQPKDQTYFLYRVPRAQLAKTLFPLSGWDKSDVRSFAQERGIPVHARPDSQDVCFLAGQNRQDILRQLAPASMVEGEVVDATGAVVGVHAGIGTVTIGQRGGLGVSGQGAPVYVQRVDVTRNQVVVGGREALAVRSLTATDPVWHGQQIQRALISVRYNQRPAPGTVTYRDGALEITLDDPVYGVALGQSAVCYSEEHSNVPRDHVALLGGGVISCVG